MENLACSLASYADLLAKRTKMQVVHSSQEVVRNISHVKNAEMILMCDECSMYRLIYSKRKLKPAEKLQLEQALDGCHSLMEQLQNTDIPEHLKDTVFVRQMSCEEPIDYSAKFTDICVYCSAPVALWNDKEQYYPQREGCGDKPQISTSVCTSCHL